MIENTKKRITEKRNKASMKIDKMKTDEILDLINREDQKVAIAVKDEIKNIEKAVDIITENMRNGGRLFYIGAGTSGRLGVLDAAECEPTFSISPNKVVGILAGGKEAMFKAQENIEDDENLGVSKMKEHNIRKNDSVIGIAASGKTPFVLGAIKEAKKRGALTVALSCTKDSKLAELSEVAIAPIVGPEVITGSTRMKAGTSQKIVLNMISTTVMIKLGKVYSNLMVDLNPTNEKLRNRAQDIFNLITDAKEGVAKKLLEKSNYNLKEAIVMYEKDLSKEKAKKLLEKHKGILRKVIN